ncbi:glycosyltransferase family 39 protein [Tropicimonas sp. TH_r6]|uniref:ArnT family glycosyltransferase n=1 Tax=Tropicimonas sp. TH_r6 TaxID=3082085 RepID=UPI002953F579|nr:glycosyltransferase family 39 protein [Tropicimonas sp. TH_r6]MDV7141094.1 glycosyltransferase family 39 protein [Tropicimonas sp. TH_r6]
MTSKDTETETSTRHEKMYSIGFFETPSTWLPIFVTTILILFVWSFQGRMIHLGALDLYDEFYTLDRTTGFARANDWFNVYTFNELNFRKPPLHYWFGAALLEQGLDLTVAVRGPSMIFALGCLIATGLLAAAVLPGQPWAIPVAVLFLSTSRPFWINASQAMLDTGALFFVTMSLAATIFALRRPRWWYVAGLCIGLGALQKAPIAFCFIALFLTATGLTARWHDHGFRTFLRNRHFQLSLLLAVAIWASWYVVQVAQHGLVVLKIGFGEQMFDRFAPVTEPARTKGISYVVSHFLGNEEILRIPAGIALVVLPFWLKRYDLLALPLMVLGYLVAVGFSGGGLSPRYALYILSTLVVGLAALLVTLPIKPRTLTALIVLLALAIGGPVRSAMDLRLFPRDLRLHQIEQLKRVAEDQDPSEQLVFCNIRSRERIPPGAISYYGTANRPFFMREGVDGVSMMVESGALVGPMRGLCRTKDMYTVEPYVTGLEVIDVGPHYTYWTADSVQSAPDTSTDAE